MPIEALNHTPASRRFHSLLCMEQAGFRSNVPGIDDSNSHGLKMIDVPGYNSHPMYERRGPNEGIPI